MVKYLIKEKQKMLSPFASFLSFFHILEEYTEYHLALISGIESEEEKIQIKK